ncbi:hypothetical protein BASA50_008714 [Batrachochytrium salamandrivorans]|uniref:Pentacotripeptide-repeat region of PRORP domain-containing protein n=2 Tax=Batrachochytrium salamandrivorans TaxID=1357716 RepID=A0ABQ8F3A5_9FUNG|nr:hypothetical protein BASA50_008714 [Batrachochytrium salamandrivorans]KAH9269785.1 hypothetical protein BASA83_008100 [Batrachochytrium salamandrivorans]KAJ1342698.1 hypothetical protein BSLG_002795 [Batrachochytrium salamandrivorans]
MRVSQVRRLVQAGQLLDREMCIHSRLYLKPIFVWQAYTAFFRNGRGLHSASKVCSSNTTGSRSSSDSSTLDQGRLTDTTDTYYQEPYREDSYGQTSDWADDYDQDKPTTASNAQVNAPIDRHHLIKRIWSTSMSQPARTTIKPVWRPGIWFEVKFTAASLQRCLLLNNVREAWTVYRMMPRHELKKLHADDHSTLLALLTSHTHPTLGEAHALTVVHRMRDYEMALDIRDYHSLLRIHLATNNEPKMVHLIKTMHHMDGIMPDIKCYNLLMALYAKSSPARLDMLTTTWIECMRQMPWARMVNMDGWALLIDGYARGGDVAGAERMYRHLLDKVGAVADPLGRDDYNDKLMLVPRIVHEAAIRMFGLAGRLDHAETLFAAVLRQVGPSQHLSRDHHGDAPHGADEHLYDAVIEACQACGNMDAARKYMKMLLDMCDEWDDKAFGKVHRYRERHGSFGSVFSSVGQLKASGSNGRYTRRDGTPLIPLGWKHGHYHLLMELYTHRVTEYQPKWRAHPLMVTFERMISMAAQTNDTLLACQYLCMHILHCTPEASSFEKVIHMYLVAGNTVAASQVYQVMLDLGFRPSVDIAQSVLMHGKADMDSATLF